MENKEAVVEVDVRKDLRLKKEPFDKIMGSVKRVKAGGTFVLHAPFNPIPLHAVLKRKGFTHVSEKIARKHWKVTYTKKEDA